MASMTSSVASSGTTTYVITDARGNTLTIAAAAQPGGSTFTSAGALAPDGMALASSLLLMLQTGLRPNVIVNTNSSLSN